MSNFVTDDTPLPYPKVDLTTLAASADATRYIRAVDWNTVCQAVIDLRAASGVSTTVAFTYTVQLGDTSSIVIPISSRASPYTVQVTLGDVANFLLVATPPSLYTSTSFTLQLSGTPTVGDTFQITVATKT